MKRLMNEVFAPERVHIPQNIRCSACGRVAISASLEPFGHERTSVRSTGVLSLDRHFSQKICNGCLIFWHQKTKVRKAPDCKEWEHAEARIEYFFNRRGIQTARTTGKGTDIMAQLFGLNIRVEVKSGWYRSDSIFARKVSPYRIKDDLVVVVLPNMKNLWMPMPEYLRSYGDEYFQFRRTAFETGRREYFFESAFLKTSLAKQNGIEKFRLIKGAKS